MAFGPAYRPTVIRLVAGTALALVLALGAAQAETARLPPEVEAAKQAYDAGDYANAVRQLAPLAEGGQATAQYLLGQAYFFGLGVERNDLLAARWYDAAAATGNAEALYRIGYLYATGQGLPYDSGQAERHWLAAAQNGHRGAIVALGDFYHEGLYRTESEVQARVWLNRAALTGDTEAMYKLGRRLMTAERLATDFRRAYAWLYIAAARGHESAKEFITKNKRFFAPHEVRRGEAWGKDFINKRVPVPAPPGEG